MTIDARLLELLPDYVLGTLPPEEQRELDQLASQSPELRVEIYRLAETLAAATGHLRPLTPPPQVRRRLLDTLDGVERFAPFYAELTRLFELPLATLRRLLARIDGTVWESRLLGVPLHGAELFHFSVGPTLQAGGAAGGVVRIRPDVTFPRHSHHGSEINYVLEGACIAGGRTYLPGERLEMSAGSCHDYRSAPGRDLVLIVLHHGVTMLPG